MTPIQEKILYLLRDIHNQQKPDSSYFDPVKGGTNSDNFYTIDKYDVIEAEAVQLEKQGYVKIMDRGNVTKGLQMTQAGIDWVITDMDTKRLAQEAQAQAQAIIDNRNNASSIVDLSDVEGIKWRAVSLILIDEINALRDWLTSFKSGTALATSLADLKTRVAKLPNTPDRTLAQFKGAYTNKITNGNAD